MRLPARLYEALPLAYIVLGLLFVSGVFYIGDRGYGPVAYLLLGFVCIAAGVAIRERRLRSRIATRLDDDLARR